MSTEPETTYFEADACHLGDFRSLVEQSMAPGDVPYAARVKKNIPIYDMPALQAELKDPALRRALMAEWADVLRSKAGVLVLKSAYQDTTVIDDATRIFSETIAAERTQNGGGGDHFAKAGANDRIWNSLQKL
jgi:ectoine hydroxylase-related dioxygenase (phytanoyl-CoA dioxygenase family)